MNIRLVFSLLLFLFSSNVVRAQFYIQDSKNPEMLVYPRIAEKVRREIVLPKVNGYNVYKVDLHTHTVFSDGSASAEFRVKEAWCDGLDAIAITDHLEYRPNEESLVQYVRPYLSGSKVQKAKNNRIAKVAPDKDGILVDMNFPYEGMAVKEALGYGITVIPGTEISRDGTTIGHYNAIFTTDNNVIYDIDPLVSMRNAKKQGAIIVHNHPGWRKTSLDYTDVDKIAYDEGLIDGVEVMNHSEFYPGLIDRALERNLFMLAASDIHTSTAAEFNMAGTHRPMTLVLAHENTTDALREALEEGRTIAYANNTLCGNEQLLKDLFLSSMTLSVISEKDARGRTVLALTNMSSIPYMVAVKGQRPDYLGSFCTLILIQNPGVEQISFEVLNMYCAGTSHPIVNMDVK